MAPSRKTTHLNKQSSNVNAVRKNGEVSRTKQKKRKLGDMGPQWNSKELQRFYEAYRKYGHEDWRKVAAAVRGRTVNMVEALYNNNLAYLSLPEGTATVTGFIAMVIDHYNMMERSDSDQESNEGREEYQKPLKRSRRRYRNSTSKDIGASLSVCSPSPLLGATLDCLSLLKATLPGSEFRVVGKRTPRVPVAVAHANDRDIYLSPKTGWSFKMDADDHVAHEIALALTKASQKDKSPQASQSTRALQRKTGNVSSLTKNDDRMRFVKGTTSAQLRKSVREEQDLEGSMGSIGTDNTDNVRRGSNVREREGTVDIQKKGKRLYGKKAMTEFGNDDLDDMKEACSDTEEHNSGPVCKKRGSENLDYLLMKGATKRIKKIVFDEDEINALEALNTLSDLSLSMPEPCSDYETKGAEIAASNAKGKGKQYIGGNEGTRNTVSSQIGAIVGAIPDSGDKSGPRKRKPPMTLPASTETSKTEKRKLPTPEGVEEMLHSASRDYQKEGGHARVGTVDVKFAQVDFPTNTRSRREKDLPKPTNHKDVKSIQQNISGRPVSGILDLKRKLDNCLSLRKAERWCTFEWFYSAIDYPWFARQEFVEYLDHVGLGHIPRLTRVEWGVIRSSLGKPRRFSRHFLKEEKVKLNMYRETVRDHYTEHRKGREGLPTDLARPLFVGQQVIAIHPKTREIHDGKVLTVDRDRCLVQFEQQELGVDFVMDIDCMPLNPLENMPAALAMSNLPENFNGDKLNGTASIHIPMPKGNMDNLDFPLSRPLSDRLADSARPIKDDMPCDNAQVKARSNLPSNEQLTLNDESSFPSQPKEVDVMAIYKMKCALDKKEIAVSDLRQMNDEVEENRRDSKYKESEAFKQRYALVLMQMKDVTEEATRDLRCLRQQNAYQGNCAMLPGKPNPIDLSVLTSSHSSGIPDTPKCGTHVSEIADSSRNKAQMMVNSAIQAMSSLKSKASDRGDEAIDYLNSHLSLDRPGASAIRSVQHTSAHADPTVHNTLETNVHIPSELITSCVATLFMIQKCTEREIAPSDVAQILDIAVTSLHPCMSQNLPVYSEIQKCMGIIRSQIMARIRV